MNKNAEGVHTHTSNSNKLNKKIILLIIIIVLVGIFGITTLKINQMQKAGEGLLAKEEQEIEQELIELNVEIKNETDTEYICLLTFSSSDENNKIKSIEYPTEEGKEPQIIQVADSDGKDKIAIDYKLNKNDFDKIFKVTTKNGEVYNERTGYKITYLNDNEVIETAKQLKSQVLPITSLTPTKEGKHFLGWSENKTSIKPDYFEDGNTKKNKDVTLYAIYTEQKNGYTENIENDSLIGKVSKINTSGVQNIEVNGVTYSANVIVINNDIVLDGEKQATGSTLVDKVYEFGNKETDVAKADADGTVANAQNMVILKVNGNLTVNYHTKLTACKSDDGYGGPKGLLVYCTGTLSNNGAIDMTARGARAEGQDVYLWKNKDNSYEYVPSEGASGGKAVSTSHANGATTVNGIKGEDGTSRKTAGGGSGSAYHYMSWLRLLYIRCWCKWDFLFRWNWRRWHTFT